jgi:hypothetical protein
MQRGARVAPVPVAVAGRGLDTFAPVDILPRLRASV